MRKGWMTAGAVAALVGLGCGAPSNQPAGGQAVDAPAGVSVTTGAPATSAAPAGPFTAVADGTYEVGTGAGQLKPGRYKTTVPGDSFGCYFARLKDVTGDAGSILSNDLKSANEPAIVQIKETDKYFETRGCGTWKVG